MAVKAALQGALGVYFTSAKTLDSSFESLSYSPKSSTRDQPLIGGSKSIALSMTVMGPPYDET
jgi:hypothetical protein